MHVALELSLDAHTPIRDDHEAHVHVHMDLTTHAQDVIKQGFSELVFEPTPTRMRAPVSKLEYTAQSEEATRNFTKDI
jgi:hypothetical protein